MSLDTSPSPSISAGSGVVVPTTTPAGRDTAGVYQPYALQVLALTGDQIAAIHAFPARDDRLFPRFSLPLVLLAR